MHFNKRTTPRNVFFSTLQSRHNTAKKPLSIRLTQCLPPVLKTLHSNHRPSWCSGNNQSIGSSVLVVNSWLWPGYKTFLEVASMVVTWWIVAFLQSGIRCYFITLTCKAYILTESMIWSTAQQVLCHSSYYAMMCHINLQDILTLILLKDLPSQYLARWAHQDLLLSAAKSKSPPNSRT